MHREEGCFVVKVIGCDSGDLGLILHLATQSLPYLRQVTLSFYGSAPHLKKRNDASLLPLSLLKDQLFSTRAVSHWVCCQFPVHRAPDLSL